MSEVIFIVGGTPNFKRSADIFGKFLQSRLNIFDISRIDIAQLEADEFQKRFCLELGRAMYNISQRPILVCFFGHGNKGNWSLNEDVKISYNFVAEAFLQVKREILLVNDCCHSFSIKGHLEKFKVSQELVGVIASCKSGQESDRSGIILSQQIENAWTKREKIQAYVKNESVICKHCSMLVTKHKPTDWAKQDVERWGKYLDSHFFPPPAKQL